MLCCTRKKKNTGQTHNLFCKPNFSTLTLNHGQTSRLLRENYQFYESWTQKDFLFILYDFFFLFFFEKSKNIPLC